MTAFALGTASYRTTRPAITTAPPPRLEIDLNTAPAHALGALPRVGPALVERVLASRGERPLASLADARSRVPGVGSATVAHIAPHVANDSTQTMASNTAAKPPRTRRGTSRRKPRLETALVNSQNPQ